MCVKNENKLAVIQKTADGVYTVREAADLLGVTARRVRQLKSEFLKEGKTAFVHGNSGKQPANHYIDENLRERVAALKESDAYSDASVTRFREFLAEREGIKISYTALSGILKAAGIVSKPKGGKRTGPFSGTREAFGEMLGAAARSHDWFGDGTPRVLHGLTDDATKRVTGLYFCRDECVKGYVEVLRQTVTNHGAPLELYSEKAGTVFGGNSLLGYMIGKRLGTDIVGDADAPHAKRRIDYLWKALRNRLPGWLKKQGITDMERANRELHRYIAAFNNRFANEPRVPESSFAPLDDNDPNLTLAVRHKTGTDSQGRFLFSGFVFTVDSDPPLADKKIEFLFGEEMDFIAYCEGKYHKVSFRGPKNRDRIVRPANALKILVQEIYYTNLDN